MKSKDYPYLDTVIYDNFHELLKARYVESADTIAIKYFGQKEIEEITYKRFVEEISAVFSFYSSLDTPIRNSTLEGGSGKRHIAIYSENRYEYLVVYLAGIFQDIMVPLDKEMDSETLFQSVKQFDIDLVICTDKTKDKVEAAGLSKDQMINLDVTYEQMIACGNCEKCVERFFENTEDTDKDTFAVLALTSGTDGRMKGVKLTQYNIITNIRGTLENNILGNPTFAFLPMNHTYGMNPCILATFYNGTTVCLNLNMKYFMRDLKAFNPDFFGAVPMVIETIYDTILREAKKHDQDRKLKVAIRASNILRLFHIDIRRRLFGDLLCSNLTKIVNGGAPLSAYYVKKFDEIGIKILNGYGLTECAPTVAVSREWNNVPGSAGTIMKHIDVKIAEDGEILVSGPNVMLGYYKDEEATRECMTEDGYIKTGDIGYTIGRVIFVTGRKKNLIVLENGKKVAPEVIEEKLNVLPYIKDSLIVSRKANNKNIIVTALVRFIDDDNQSEYEKLLKVDIKDINSRIPSYMAVGDYEIMEEDFAKTGTMKIKRKLYG